MHRIAKQDLQAFDTLYTRYAPRLRAYLARLLSDQTAVDEVCNDVMLVIWQRATQVPATVPLWAWLCGIARHKARKARARRSSDAAAPVMHAEDNAETPEHILLYEEYRSRFTHILETLPCFERTIMAMRVQQGYAYQDIAALLDIPVSTVRTRVSRACQRLQELVATADRLPPSPSP
jgi:RNA polymerase sigma-70 factor (ECF subfamily)